MTTDVIQIRKVSKRYRVKSENLLVLEGLNLAVRQGEFLSIVGASGCGKSTLLRLLVGLESDFEGEIFVKGSPVTGTSLDRGLVFQEHRLFPWLTVEENVAVALENSSLSPDEKRQSVKE